MAAVTYETRRGELLAYFDRTAVEAWERLTSDAPVGRIRATVRAGREEMRSTLVSWLPPDLRGARVLDAGCGTGALALEAAGRGAEVTAVDLSPRLIELARERTPRAQAGRVAFLVGDMLEPSLGRFDHAVCMDSLIHYEAPDLLAALVRLAPRVHRSILFTFAPRTLPLAIMHRLGRLFPRSDRAPAIEPVAEPMLRRLIEGDRGLKGWRLLRSQRVANGFYTSQALELVRA